MRVCNAATCHAFEMRGASKRLKSVGKRMPVRRRQAPSRAKLLISKGSPITQIEIEVVAALLDDRDVREFNVQQKPSN